MKPRYEAYGLEDFLNDRSFIGWVKYNRPEDDVFWNQWEAGAPANLETMQQARLQLILMLSVPRIQPTQEEQEKVWLAISQSLEGVKRMPLYRKPAFWLAAASIAALVLITGLLYQNSGTGREEAVATAFGQIKSFDLEDRSAVKLNANSSIRFQRHWRQGQPRRVYMKGEAFFNVRHTDDGHSEIKPEERFEVHTDHVIVEVLGTVFNVKERRNKVQVSLESGRVKVTVKGDSTKSLELQPGELAEYNAQTKNLQKITRNPAVFKAWTEQNIIAENATLNEILQGLEDTYGYRIVLEDAALGNKRIEGVLPIKNEENLFFVLSNVLDADIEKRGKVVTIRSRK